LGCWKADGPNSSDAVFTAVIGVGDCQARSSCRFDLVAIYRSFAPRLPARLLAIISLSPAGVTKVQ
jgi:hypothetical protein